MKEMVTAQQDRYRSAKRKSPRSKTPKRQKKKPALQARAKNFQGVVLQRRTAFMVVANASVTFAQTQSACGMVPES
jgi:hypothetical protein